MSDPVIVLALPLDHGVADVIEAASAIAPRLGAAVLPVHARGAGDEDLPHVRANGGVRASILRWLEPLAAKVVTILEPVLEVDRPERAVARAAARSGAELVVAGSGRGATIRDWVLGTTADRLLRASTIPVFLARGTLPSASSPVLCPIDLLDHSRLALAAGLRWARAFGAPLRVLHVRSEIAPLGAVAALDALDQDEARAREAIAVLLGSLDTAGVTIEVVVHHGPIVAMIERGARDAGLVVAVQPDWETMVPASLGSRACRWIHASRASLIAIRDADPPRQRELREDRARWIGTLLSEAEAAMREGDPARAERLLDNAKIAAPVSAPVEDALARAIAAQGRAGEADRHASLARWLRASFA